MNKVFALKDVDWYPRPVLTPFGRQQLCMLLVRIVDLIADTFLVDLGISMRLKYGFLLEVKWYALFLSRHNNHRIEFYRYPSCFPNWIPVRYYLCFAYCTFNGFIMQRPHALFRPQLCQWLLWSTLRRQVSPKCHHRRSRGKSFYSIISVCTEQLTSSSITH